MQALDVPRLQRPAPNAPPLPSGLSRRLHLRCGCPGGTPLLPTDHLTVSLTGLRHDRRSDQELAARINHPGVEVLDDFVDLLRRAEGIHPGVLTPEHNSKLSKSPRAVAPRIR